MFGIAAIGGDGEYYVGLASSEYYLGGGEPPGKWVGAGAGALGLSGRVHEREFRRLMRGFSPNDNEALVQNAGQDNHRAGWDLTFSAPKSVSILWSQLGEGERALLQATQQRAVEAALSYLQDVAAWTRTGKGGAVWQKAGLTIATFEHASSRAQDPQLHTHCVLANVGVRSDGATSALETRPLYLHQHQADALYRAELAAGIERELGYRIERKKSWFEVAGISDELIEAFSKRRAAIFEALRDRADLGLPGSMSSAGAREKAALSTRETKEHIARKELFEQWQRAGGLLGFSLGALPRLSPEERFAPEVREVELCAEVLAQAITGATSQQTTFTEREFVRRAAQEALGTGLGAESIREVVRLYLLGQEQGLASGDAAVALGVGSGGEHRFTTRDTFELEQRMLAAVEASRGRAQSLSEESVRSAERFRTLSDEQRAALHFVTREPGSIKAVVGMAGTGKSYLLGAVREAFEKEGYAVIGAALAGKVACELEEGSGIKSTTLHGLLYELDAGRARGRSPLHQKSVVVVDEAAMASNCQIARLVEETQKCGARLILVGDARQLQAIEQGGAFKSIAERLGAAKLETILRQDGEDAAWQKAAIQDFAAGRAAAALGAYQERGRVTVTTTARQAMSRAVDDWQKLGGAERPAEHLLIAARRIEVRALNRKAQAARASLGRLGASSLEVGEQRFHAGDRVLFTRNHRVLGIENGNLGTVEAVDLKRRSLTVRLDKGTTVTVGITDYQHLELGYAITTHKGQGTTVRANVYVLAGGPMQDLHLSYVQASRAKAQTRFYMHRAEAGEELTALIEKMSRSREKYLAHDVGAWPRVGQQLEHGHGPMQGAA